MLNIVAEDTPEYAGFVGDSWQAIEAAVDSILDSDPQRIMDVLATSPAMVSRWVEILCKLGQQPKILQKLHHLFERHIRGVISDEIKDMTITYATSQSCDSMDYLKALNKRWKAFGYKYTLVHHLFTHLKIDLVHVATLIFGKLLCEEKDIAHFMADSLNQVLLEDRQTLIKRPIEHYLVLAETVRMYMKVGVFFKYFLTLFYNSLSTFYKTEKEQNLAQMELAEYLQYFKMRMQREEDCILHPEMAYLPPQTLVSVRSILYKQLIINSEEAILSKNFSALVDTQQLAVLRLLFQVFSKVNAHDRLKAAFAIYIKSKGELFLADHASFIENLLPFKVQMDEILQVALGNHPAYKLAFKEALEFVLVREPSLSAENIARYMHKLLKAGLREKTSAEFDQLIINTIQLFKLLTAKDVFERHYKIYFGKRLLCRKSFSQDVEKIMLVKLKDECGPFYTTKLESMFKDMELSSDVTDLFRNFIATNPSGLHDPADFHFKYNISIIRSGIWPNYLADSQNVRPSALIKRLISAFTDFYTSKYDSRTLQFYYHLGRCRLASYANVQDHAHPHHAALDPLLIDCHAYHGLILLCFNQNESNTIAFINKKTGISVGVLISYLQNLIQTSTPLLTLCDPASPDRAASTESAVIDLSEADVNTIVYLNTEFKTNLPLLKVSFDSKSSYQKQSRHVEEDVRESRYIQIDAAIVRTLKKRKTITYSELTDSLFQMLAFPLSTDDVNARIENLVKRDFICRDEYDANTYHYA